MKLFSPPSATKVRINRKFYTFQKQLKEANTKKRLQLL